MKHLTFRAMVKNGVDVSQAGTDIAVFGIPRRDPGFLYMFESEGRYKVGRTTNPKSRVSAARTWLPSAKLIGVKPFWQHSGAEFYLHLGFAQTWLTQEWFAAPDEGYQECMVEEFQAFSDTEIDRNSVDFVYWINGSGMSELIREFNECGVSKAAFLKAMQKY